MRYFSGLPFWIVFFALVLWLGTAVSVSFLVAPILFIRFPVEMAADALGAIFPVYGQLHIAAAILASFLLVVFCKQFAVNRKLYWASLGTIGCGALLALLQGLFLFPQTKALRALVVAGRARGDIDSVANEAARMMTLHQWSMRVNTAIILLALVSLILFIYLDRNRSQGELNSHGR